MESAQYNSEERMRKTSRAAFAFWEDRIAPVFDVARQVLLVEREPDGSGNFPEAVVQVLPETASLKTKVLLDAQVGTLICGAISRPLQDSLEQQGIRVLPFVMGQLDALIQAWRSNQLVQDAFLMPGCRGRQAGRPQGRQQGRGGGRSGRKPGQTGRMGQGKGGGFQGGRGRMRGTADVEQTCVCPHCGYSAPHMAGSPCVELRCPHCQSVLVRAG